MPLTFLALTLSTFEKNAPNESNIPGKTSLKMCVCIRPIFNVQTIPAKCGEKIINKSHIQSLYLFLIIPYEHSANWYKLHTDEGDKSL